jgi:hypothetical protein
MKIPKRKTKISNNQHITPYIDDNKIEKRCYHRSILNYVSKYHPPKGFIPLEMTEYSSDEETLDECLEFLIEENDKYDEFLDRISINSKNHMIEKKRRKYFVIEKKRNGSPSPSSLTSFMKQKRNVLYSKIKHPYTQIKDKSKILEWCDIPKDIKFNIFLFLSPNDIKGWDRESYSLACSRQAWKQHLNKIWSHLCNNENEGYHIQFDYDYLTTNDESCKKINNINFKMLYALSTSYPSQMGINISSTSTNDICFQKYEMISSTNCYATSKRRLQVYQLYSTTWLDSVCICSDLPFPIKKKVLSPSSSSSLFCYPQKPVQPFIAPFATKLDDSNEATTLLEMNLSPRFVAYYEVTLLQRDKTQEPKCLNTIARNSSAFECVAIGLSLKKFLQHRVMPGWDKDSYGYHGDDGGIFHNQGQMLRNYGPTFASGDTVGCGIDYIENAIFFYTQWQVFRIRLGGY